MVYNTVGHHPVNLSLNLSLLLPRHNDQMLSPLLPGQLAQALILRASPAQYSASSSPLTESRWPAPSVHSSRCRRDAGKPESHLATTTAVFHSTHFVGLANPDTHLAHSCHLVTMSPNVPSWLRSPPVFVVVLKTFIEMMSVSIIGGSQGNTEQCRPII